MRIYAKTHHWVYQKFLNELARRKIGVLNAGRAMYDSLHGRDFCSIVQPRNCSTGHYTEEGYRMLAQIIANKLGRLGFERK